MTTMPIATSREGFSTEHVDLRKIPENPLKAIDAGKKIAEWADDYLKKYGGEGDNNMIRRQYLSGMAQAFKGMDQLARPHEARARLPETRPDIGTFAKYIPTRRARGGVSCIRRSTPGATLLSTYPDFPG
ncbi:MAG: hypothetical protein ACRD29_12925 [Acidimicrobiales bacterium]